MSTVIELLSVPSAEIHDFVFGTIIPPIITRAKCNCFWALSMLTTIRQTLSSVRVLISRLHFYTNAERAYFSCRDSIVICSSN